MDTFKTTDVFTPSKPATITFVERDDLTEQLVNAIWTPGKQIVVYGHSGSGKTTLLLNKLQQTRERRRGHTFSLRHHRPRTWWG